MNSGELPKHPVKLEISTSIISGELHPDLQNFLEKEVPKSKKKVQVTLGVGDSKIAAAISETLGISVQHSGVVVELNRGLFLSNVLLYS